MGMNKPVHVVPRDTEVEEIVNVAAIAVVDAQENDMLLLGRTQTRRDGRRLTTYPNIQEGHGFGRAFCLISQSKQNHDNNKTGRIFAEAIRAQRPKRGSLLSHDGRQQTQFA